jgi:hypothetical protein
LARDPDSRGYILVVHEATLVALVANVFSFHISTHPQLIFCLTSIFLNV